MKAASAAGLAVLSVAALLAASCGAGPLQSGGDTRDIDRIPAVDFEGSVTVRPGEGGVLAFTVTNRYNQTMQSVRWELEFQVGGDWLEARALANETEKPALVPISQVPRPLDVNSTLRVEAPFTTTPKTAPGVYLVSLVILFGYTDVNGSLASARFISLGSVPSWQREFVDMSDYNGTLDALGVDGIVPDSSVQVDGGGAAALWWAAVAFGVAVVVLGTAFGVLSARREPKRRR